MNPIHVLIQFFVILKVWFCGLFQVSKDQIDGGLDDKKSKPSPSSPPIIDKKLGVLNTDVASDLSFNDDVEQDDDDDDEEVEGEDVNHSDIDEYSFSDDDDDDDDVNDDENDDRIDNVDNGENEGNDDGFDLDKNTNHNDKNGELQVNDNDLQITEGLNDEKIMNEEGLIEDEGYTEVEQEEDVSEDDNDLDDVDDEVDDNGFGEINNNMSGKELNANDKTSISEDSEDTEFHGIMDHINELYEKKDNHMEKSSIPTIPPSLVHFRSLLSQQTSPKFSIALSPYNYLFKTKDIFGNWINTVDGLSSSHENLLVFIISILMKIDSMNDLSYLNALFSKMKSQKSNDENDVTPLIIFTYALCIQYLRTNENFQNLEELLSLELREMVELAMKDQSNDSEFITSLKIELQSEIMKLYEQVDDNNSPEGNQMDDEYKENNMLEPSTLSSSHLIDPHVFILYKTSQKIKESFVGEEIPETCDDNKKELLTLFNSADIHEQGCASPNWKTSFDKLLCFSNSEIQFMALSSIIGEWKKYEEEKKNEAHMKNVIAVLHECLRNLFYRLVEKQETESLSTFNNATSITNTTTTSATNPTNNTDSNTTMLPFLQYLLDISLHHVKLITQEINMDIFDKIYQSMKALEMNKDNHCKILKAQWYSMLCKFAFQSSYTPLHKRALNLLESQEQVNLIQIQPHLYREILEICINAGYSRKLVESQNVFAHLLSQDNGLMLTSQIELRFICELVLAATKDLRRSPSSSTDNQEPSLHSSECKRENIHCGSSYYLLLCACEYISKKVYAVPLKMNTYVNSLRFLNKYLQSQTRLVTNRYKKLKRMEPNKDYRDELDDLETDIDVCTNASRHFLELMKRSKLLPIL